jgi:putative hydrolase of the HAD superfamily
MFDIYGTLFISGSGDIGMAKKDISKVSGFETLMKRYSVHLSPDALLDGFIKKIKEIHEKLMAQGVDFPEVHVDQVWMELLNMDEIETARAFSVEFEMIINPVYPMPHVKQMIDKLRSKNVHMGIISNAQFYTQYLFEWFLGKKTVELGFHPDLIIYSYQYGYAKPSSFLFKLAADKLKGKGISCNSVLYIGNDMLNDIYAANKAGFLTALFAGDKRSLRMREDDPRCKSIEPDFIVTDLMQLIDYVM